MFKPFSRAQGNLKGPFPISSVRDYCTVFKRMIDSLKFNTFRKYLRFTEK